VSLHFGVGSRSRLGNRLVVVLIVAVVAFVAAGAWKASHSDSRNSERAPARQPRAIAFHEQLPVLKAILETPPTASVANAVKELLDRAARTAMPLHRRVTAARPLRVLVVGDSVGVTFARGMDRWGRSHGNVEVRDDARSWCALGRGLRIQQGLAAGAPSAGCAGWAKRWSDAVRSFDPDVVFVYFSIWEVSPRLLPETGEWLQPGDPRLDTWQLSEYQAAADVLSARGAPVVWFTIPCENEPIRGGSPLWHVNRRTIPELAASRRAVHVVDLDRELCRNGPSHDYAGVVGARPDGAHFSDAGALAVANWVMSIVIGDAPNPTATEARETDSQIERLALATRTAS
jgi:hypothetical protein